MSRALKYELLPLWRLTLTPLALDSSTSAATSTGRDGVSSTSTTASAPFATHTPAASDSARSESYLDKGAVIGGVLGGLVALVLALVALWWLRRRRTRRRKSDACTTESSHAASTYNPSRPRPPPSSMSISPPGATVSSWLGRSRPRSQRDAFGASGSRASVDGSNEAPADVPRWSQGPRADLPEVGEVGDFRAYHVGGGGPPAPLGRGAQLADASLAPRNGGVHSPTEEDLPLPSTLRPRAGRNGADGVALSSPPQLPATMTTPGALTTYGDEDRGGAAPERAGYASRPAGSGRRA